MQEIRNRQGSGRTGWFPIKGTVDELDRDLAALGFPVENGPEEPQGDIFFTTMTRSTPEAGEQVLVTISALLEHEEQGQPVDAAPRDMLDVLARHLRDGFVAVLDERPFRGRSARRWAVDSKGERVSIDLVDIEEQIMERLDCSAGMPDLD